MTLKEFEAQLRQSKNQWEFRAYQEIKHNIPKGHVITYGGLAKRVHVCARNIGNLRNKLLDFFGIDGKALPLHRIATKGDSTSENDAADTKVENERLRRKEKSWPEPIWLYE
jgi:alkylated DNA nucleotide flippase Atl1